MILPENNVSVNTLAYTPIVDSVEEFSVITNALAAEYGRTGGGVINASYFPLGNQLLGTNQVPNPFYGIILNPTSSLFQPTVAHSQLLKPFPQYSSVSPFRKPQANSLYHSLSLRVEKRFSHGLNLLLSYTGGKLIDDASQVVTFLGAAGTKQDYYNRKAERSMSAQDVSRQLSISFNYDVPVGKGRMFLTHAHSAGVDYRRLAGQRDLHLSYGHPVANRQRRQPD